MSKLHEKLPPLLFDFSSFVFGPLEVCLRNTEHFSFIFLPAGTVWISSFFACELKTLHVYFICVAYGILYAKLGLKDSRVGAHLERYRKLRGFHQDLCRKIQGMKDFKFPPKIWTWWGEPNPARLDTREEGLSAYGNDCSESVTVSHNKLFQKCYRLIGLLPSLSLSLSLSLTHKNKTVKRDIAERGRSLESVLSQYQKTVKPSYDLFCAPVQSFFSLLFLPGGKMQRFCLSSVFDSSVMATIFVSLTFFFVAVFLFSCTSNTNSVACAWEDLLDFPL